MSQKFLKLIEILDASVIELYPPTKCYSGLGGLVLTKVFLERTQRSSLVFC